jgi:hypothetical protein
LIGSFRSRLQSYEHGLEVQGLLKRELPIASIQAATVRLDDGRPKVEATAILIRPEALSVLLVSSLSASSISSTSGVGNAGIHHPWTGPIRDGLV